MKKLSYFTKRMIYWTNDFTRKSFSAKSNEIDGKLTIILRTDEIKFFERLKKLYTKWVVHERRTTEIKETVHAHLLAQVHHILI